MSKLEYPLLYVVLAVFLAACGRGTQVEVDSRANAPRINFACAGHYVGTGGVVCEDDYCIFAGEHGNGCVNLDTGEFQIGEGSRITYQGNVIVQGPAEGNLFGDMKEAQRPEPPVCPWDQTVYW